eukprot:XP_001709725.1 Reverse transcriptase/endonuclease, putative [Giardia lamblia ATCC 50803]
MPGLYHDELRRAWASLDVNKGTRDPVELPVDGQALQGKGTYFNRLLTRTHQLPDRAAAYCLQMCGVLTEEERALKQRDGSIMAQTRGTCPGCHTADPRPRHELPESGVDQDHEARHDRHVPVPPRLGEVQRRPGGQDPQPPQRPEPEARHLARRQVQGDRCGRHPAPPDGCLLQREGQEVQGRDRRIPPPQSKRRLEELHVDVEKLSVRAAFAIAHMAAEANEHLTKLIRRAGPKAWSPRATVSCHPTSDNRMSPSPGPDDNDREGAQDWTRSRVESQPGENAPLAAADLYGQY